jgi:hypothetical protein
MQEIENLLEGIKSRASLEADEAVSPLKSFLFDFAKENNISATGANELVLGFKNAVKERIVSESIKRLVSIATGNKQ